MEKYYYTLILFFSVVIPFIMSFEKRVHYVNKWKYFFIANLPCIVLFVIWDLIFTQQGVWSFNDKYILGFYFFNLPLEEVLFFILIPFACIFIYENINFFLRNLYLKNLNKVAALIGMMLLISIFICEYEKYTSSVISFLALELIIISFVKPLYTAKMLLTYLICPIPFLIVNGLLTWLPIVIYNDKMNLGIKLLTIPIEDIFYGLSLFIMNTIIYETLKERKRKTISNLRNALKK